MATNFSFLESNWPTLLDDAQQVELNVMASLPFTDLHHQGLAGVTYETTYRSRFFIRCCGYWDIAFNPRVCGVVEVGLDAK